MSRFLNIQISDNFTGETYDCFYVNCEDVSLIWPMDVSGNGDWGVVVETTGGRQFQLEDTYSTVEEACFALKEFVERVERCKL